MRSASSLASPIPCCLPARAQIPLQPAEHGGMAGARKLLATAANIILGSAERRKDTDFSMRGSSALYGGIAHVWCPSGCGKDRAVALSEQISKFLCSPMGCNLIFPTLAGAGWPQQQLDGRGSAPLSASQSGETCQSGFLVWRITPHVLEESTCSGFLWLHKRWYFGIWTLAELFPSHPNHPMKDSRNWAAPCR